MARTCMITPWSMIDGSLSRLLHDFVAPASAPAVRSPGFAPPLTAWETETQFGFQIELPGLAEGDVELELLDGVLTIRGTLPDPVPEGAKVLRSERPTGEFARSVRLPGEIDDAAVEARLEHGVLRIAIPKRPEARPRRIEIGRPTVA